MFRKLRPVPYAMRWKIEKEGVLVPVASSEWAMVIVAVVKANGDIRICGNYEITLNPNLKN